MLSWRKAAIKVELCQWPCGMALRQRWPIRQRPWWRAILVFKPVSSINTNWRTSQLGCCFRQSLRAVLTSGRSCSAARVVFFIAQTQLFQTVPQSGDANGNFQVLQTPFLEFAQGQIRLRYNPAAQSSVMLFQAGAPVTADLFGRHSPVRRCCFQKRSTLLRLTPKRRQTSPVPAPRSRAATIRCRKS
jgi:hypothetical protein